MKLILSVVFTLFYIVSSAVGEVIKHAECRDVASQCTIHDVQISPCPQAAQDSANPCHIKRGRSATIDFNYTTEFDATNATSEIFWISEEGDLPYVGMDKEACLFTECPISQGQRKSYSQKFNTMRKFPARIFDLKWKLTNVDNSEQLCCFVFKIKLTK